MTTKIGAGASAGLAAAAAAKAAARAAAAKAAAEAAKAAAAKAAAAASKLKDAFGGVGLKGGLSASVKGDGFENKPNSLRLSAGVGASIKTDDFETTKPKSRFDFNRSVLGAMTLSPDDTRTVQTPADEVKEAQLTNQISNDAGTKLSAAKTEYDDAKEVVDRNKGRLAEELKRIGPGLTPRQKEAYIKAYEAEHAPELAKAKEAATQLAAVLNETKGQLDPTGAKLAMDTAKALAKTPEGAETAKNFVKELSNNPDSPLYKGLVESQGVEEVTKQLQETLGAAIPNLYAEALKSTDGDPDAAAAKLKQGLDGLDSGKGVLGNMEAFNKGLDALLANDTAALKAMDSANPLSNALKVAGVMLGIAKVANGTAEAQDVLGAGKDGIEVTALAMEALAKTLPTDGSLASAATTGSKWLNKLAPGIGMVASAMSAAADFKALCTDPNAGDLLKLVGNAMSTVGGALALTGVGEVVAVPLQVVGGLITATGGIVSQLREENIITEESKKLLRASGVDEAFIQQLTSASPKALRTLEETGMSPEQVQELMSKHPEVFSNPVHQERFAEAAKACGLQGENVLKFAEALKKDNPDYPMAHVPYNNRPGIIRNIVRSNFPSTRELVAPSPYS